MKDGEKMFSVKRGKGEPRSVGSVVALAMLQARWWS